MTRTERAQILAARAIIALAALGAILALANHAATSCRTDIILGRAGNACLAFAAVDPYWPH